MDINYTDMLSRKLDNFIEKHYANNKSALLLKGARQVGKTSAIRKYARKQKMNLIEINFYEDDSACGIFKGSQNAKDVLLRISAHTKKKTSLPNTMIFFDEVQKCPEVITWIKFLVDEGSCKYALSGSLLGVELKGVESVPVGYMSVKEVFPLDIEEFSRCLGLSDEVLTSVGEAFEKKIPVDEVVHAALMKMIHLYLVVGGMPAAVQAYVDTNDLNVVEEKQKEILDLYKWDISQYDPNKKLEINEIFNLIPSELDAKNKRFILKNLNEHARFSRYENSFLWLKNAGVAIPTLNIQEPTFSFKLNELRNLFKLFRNDVGLLTGILYGNNVRPVLNDMRSINLGSVYENAVAQELASHGHKLFYYDNRSKGEVDFLIDDHNTISVLPVEVKSGKDYTKHSALDNFMKVPDYHISSALVLNDDREIRVVNNVTYAPVYNVMFLSAKEQNPEDLIF